MNKSIIKNKLFFVAIVGIFTSQFYFEQSFAACKQDAKVLPQGKVAYSTNCATCHGEKGDGLGPAGAALKARNFLKDSFKAGDSVEKIFLTTTKGLPGTAMAPFSHVSEPDRCAIANYVFSLRNSAKK